MTDLTDFPPAARRQSGSLSDRARTAWRVYQTQAEAARIFERRSLDTQLIAHANEAVGTALRATFDAETMQVGFHLGIVDVVIGRVLDDDVWLAVAPEGTGWDYDDELGAFVAPIVAWGLRGSVPEVVGPAHNLEALGETLEAMGTGEPPLRWPHERPSAPAVDGGAKDDTWHDAAVEPPGKVRPVRPEDRRPVRPPRPVPPGRR